MTHIIVHHSYDARGGGKPWPLLKDKEVTARIEVVWRCPSIAAVEDNIEHHTTKATWHITAYEKRTFGRPVDDIYLYFSISEAHRPPSWGLPEGLTDIVSVWNGSRVTTTWAGCRGTPTGTLLGFDRFLAGPVSRKWILDDANQH
ncbi:hypothetical protein H2201_000814 [Coniosporium apollinis]|uniref:Uncharacterized protein n=2 Tax=Coniosporium TaxID=2810619 RepID=A0ABQ9P4H6_9PEZI|nr:hypothetical protein H2199_001333 [Cladosporium sp. JES 115]KAJ9668988.1 hypothetical protein H2201_000814 [Coniosporium apollinis]